MGTLTTTKHRRKSGSKRPSPGERRGYNCTYYGVSGDSGIPRNVRLDSSEKQSSKRSNPDAFLVKLRCL